MAMKFSAWLREYRMEQGWTQPELAAWLNRQGLVKKAVDKQLIYNWESGRSQPDYHTCLAIGFCAGLADPYSTFLGVSNGYKLNEQGWRKLDEYAHLLEESPRYALAAAPPAQKRKLLFYDIPVSAGRGQFLDSDRCEWREVGRDVPAEADYAVRIAGDSMEPRYEDRQWIFVHEQQDIDPGEIGIFLYDGESYCKKLGEADGKPALFSLNPQYSPIMITLFESFHVLGKVVG